jgi:hypothetical protein
VFSVVLLERKSGAKVLQSNGNKFVLSVKTRFSKNYLVFNAIKRKNYHLWQIIQNNPLMHVFHLRSYHPQFNTHYAHSNRYPLCVPAGTRLSNPRRLSGDCNAPVRRASFSNLGVEG